MKTLIAYFSHTGENYSVGVIEKGNTEIVAEYIKEFTNGNLFEIKPVKQYSKIYKECCDEAMDDYNSNARPELQEYLDSIEEYDTIYLGYPIWWGTMPMAVWTFLEHYDFTGKTIIPFSTHEGSGLGKSASDIKKLIPSADVKDGFEVQGSTVKSAKEKIKQLKGEK